MKLLLHACCGPCSLEPVRLLQADGHDLTLAFMNSNIQPAAEYDHRLDTLRTWAQEQGIPVVEGVYDEAGWHDNVGVMELVGAPRIDRCRRCYALRLSEAAEYAATHGFEGVATTLSVSPYQFSEVIHEELEAACDRWNIEAVFQDYRPYYDEATRRSREAGMYRQNYCGCVYSDAEAQAERAERKAQRAAEKEARAAERAPIDKEMERQREIARAEAAEYNEKQRRKREARNAARRAAREAERAGEE